MLARSVDGQNVHYLPSTRDQSLADSLNFSFYNPHLVETRGRAERHLWDADPY